MKNAPTRKIARRWLLPFVAFTLALIVGTAVGLESAFRPRLGPDAAEAPTGSVDIAAPTMARAADGRLTVLSHLADDVKGKPRQVAEQTVIVRANRSYATGFVVRGGYVMTAAHVAGGSESPEVSVHCWGVDAAADAVHIDTLRDTMILHAEHCGGMTLRFDERARRDREPVHVAGYSFRFDVNGALRYHRLTAAFPEHVFEPEPGPTADHMARMRENGVARLQAFGTVLERGNSGSPVCDEDGAIIGMFVIIDPRTRSSFMVPASTLVRVLSDANIP